MTKAFLLGFLILFGFLAHARTVSVKGYTRKDGTYVQPHYRTSPNHSKLDNWSTRGNVNPYTGKAGTKDPYGNSSTGTFEIQNEASEGHVGPTEKENVSRESKAKTTYFEQATSDCSIHKGSTTEAWCIKERIKNLKEIDILHSQSHFSQAYDDCSIHRGSTTEAWCIKDRIRNIKEIENLKTKADFEQAQSDCSIHSRSTTESWCIRERLKNIAEIRKLSAQ